MGTGVSIFLIAVGAILTFALDMNTDGFSLDAVGVILMVVGLLGLLFSLAVWDNWGPGRRRDYVDDRDVVVCRDPVVVDDQPVVRSTVRRSYH